MSKENVEILRQLLPAPEVNIADLLRSDELIDAWRELMEPVFWEDFECELLGGTFGRRRFVGFDGLREAWVDWVAPWATYRTEIEELVDLGDRVLAIVTDYGRRDDTTPEVMLAGGTIWTFEQGKVKRAAFYPDRHEALEAAGLSE